MTWSDVEREVKCVRGSLGYDGGRKGKGEVEIQEAKRWSIMHGQSSSKEMLEIKLKLSGL